MYLESVAMLPQLYMFIRSASAGGDTTPGSVPGGGTFIGTTLHHNALHTASNFISYIGHSIVFYRALHRFLGNRLSHYKF